MRTFVAALSCFMVGVVMGSPVGEGFCIQETVYSADLPLYRKVPPMATACYDALIGNTTEIEGHHITTEAIQSYFNTMCPGVPNFRACLGEIASSLEVCSNPNILTSFNIMRDAMVKTAETGCAEGGKLFVKLAKGFVDIEDGSQIGEQIKVCGAKTATILGAIEKFKVDLASKYFILHKEFSKFVECVSKIHLGESLGESLDYFFNEVMTTMKCIHPQDGTLVTCASIGVDSISAHSICEAKTHGSTFDLYDILENDVYMCFNLIVKFSSEEDITEDKEAFRANLKEACDMKIKAKRCVEEPKTIAEACLNDTQKNEFKHVVPNFHMRLEATCVDDGRRLGDIMFEVYRLKKTGHGDAMRDCIDVSRSTRNVTDEHRSSSKNMRFYHELESFKTCLVNKLHGDQTSVDAATSLIDEMLNNMECGVGETGTPVTCESLMQNHNHNHNHH